MVQVLLTWIRRLQGIEFEVGVATIVKEDIPRTDCNAINDGKASITPLGSWPSNHP